MVWAGVVCGGIGGCAAQDTDGESQDDLQALLRDAPLKQVPPAAAVAKTGVAARVAGAAPTANLISGSPIGVWHFDDCNSSRTELSDGTFNGNSAFRTVNVACAAGIQGQGQGVQIAATEDMVYVPDEPNFTFENGVTVAGWFNPAATGGTKTLFRKRDKGTSSFALLLDAGKFEFVVNIGDGHAISVISPKRAKAGVYQHVAGTYDGTTIRLYVDGIEANNFTAPGVIPLGPGPLLMGNDGSERRFAGAIDDALFATHALSASEVQLLTCFPQFPTVVTSPGSLTTPAGVPATIDVAITNHNSASCPAAAFQLNTFFAGNDVTIDPAPGTTATLPVASGETKHFTITVTPSESIEPDSFFFIDFDLFDPLSGFSSFGSSFLTVTEPLGCHVSTPRELTIKNTSVVDDAVRTAFDPSSSDARNGVWSFKHLVENMAATPADAPAMVEAMLTSMTTSQTINGFTIDGRPGVQTSILDNWARTADGALDLSRPPLRLLAIVDRFDLRNLANGDAGEGRFVFGFTDPTFFDFPQQATIILEYKLPAASDADVRGWADSFHALGALAFGESYNAALQAITERFVGRNARPDHPNGSAINAVRTNEIAFGNGAPWEMRQFALSAATGRLEPSTLDLTPDRSFNFSDTLVSYINANQAAIIAETHTVPASFAGQPFQAGAVFNLLDTWFAPGTDNDARHHFALNTCNGCHSSQETGTFFLQIQPRFAFEEAQLSGFLTGITVSDPVTGESRTFNDLARRNRDLKAIVCAEPGLAGTSLRKGIQRVH